MLWNKLRYAKNPETGKRVSRVNPASEWIIKEVPDLRIIDQEIWEAAKAKQGKINKHAKSGFWQARRPKHLFSYLIKCGECGGGCSMLNGTQIGCSSARNKGTCGNTLSISRKFLEEDILGALQSQLMDPELCALFCKEYTEHLNRLRRTRIDATANQRTELAQLERERIRMVEAIKNGVPAEMIKEDAERISSRMEVLKSALSNEPAAEPILHPAMADMYTREVQRLIKTLTAPAHREEAADIIRGLIDRIVLTPDASKTRLVVNLEGDLAGILAMSVGEEPSEGGMQADLDVLKSFSRTIPLRSEFGMSDVVGKAGCGSRI